MTSIFGTMALSGGSWVIYGLLLCSILAVGIMIERWILISAEEKNFHDLHGALMRHLGENPATLDKTLREHPGAASRILLSGFSQARHGVAGVEDLLVAAGLEEKSRLEQRLLVLGTMGNNAPFIGLFGTVLGVIKAFHDLAQSGAGPEAVMQGLSEALVATAVGLFVAIPCVVGYNYFSKRVRDILSGTEALGRIMLAHIRAQAG